MSGLSAGVRPSLLAPFGNRSFRFMWPADLLTSWAFETETLILGWYVLVQTQSVLALTVFGALQFTGTLLSPLFGVVGDRIGARNLLCLMRGFYGVQASCLMAFAALDVLTPVHVFAIGFCMGWVRPSDLAIRNTLVGSMMPPDQLMAAMGISRTTQDSARIAGAVAGAGLFALVGMAAAYGMVVAFYAASLALTLGIHRPARAIAAAAVSPLRDVREGLAYVWTTKRLLAAMVLAFLVNFCAFPLSGGLLPYVAREVYGLDQSGLGFMAASLALTLGIHRPARAIAAAAVSPLRDVREGLAYVWTTKRLLAAMVLAFLVNFCAFPLSGGLLPYVAREVYGLDQSGLGFMAAAFAFGGLLGSIMLSTAGRRIPAGRIMIGFAFVWYGLLLAYANMAAPIAGIALLMLAGFAQSLCMVPMAVMLLRSSGDRFRGRVMGVRMLAVYGMPLGLLLAGVMIRQFGFAATATGYCVFGLAASFAIAWYWWRDLWPRGAQANLG